MEEQEKNRRVRKVTQITRNRYLNFYNMDVVDTKGNPCVYNIASRSRDVESLKLSTRENPADGVVIYALYGEDMDQVVLIRQYRYSIGDYIYEFPAGLVDEGEDFQAAGIRELKEETGLDFAAYEDGESAFRRPFYLGAGLTDETSTSIFGFAGGEISDRLREDTESIEVLLVDKKEALRILTEERVSLRAAFLLMLFLQSKAEKPFGFLDKLG